MVVEIGFVLPEPSACVIHHNLSVITHLCLLLLPRKLAWFRTIAPRLFVGWASSPDSFRGKLASFRRTGSPGNADLPIGLAAEIGFVLPEPQACMIHHNFFATQHLSHLPLSRKLALFRTIAPRFFAAWASPPDTQRG